VSALSHMPVLTVSSGVSSEDLARQVQKVASSFAASAGERAVEIRFGCSYDSRVTAALLSIGCSEDTPTIKRFGHEPQAASPGRPLFTRLSRCWAITWGTEISAIEDTHGVRHLFYLARQPFVDIPAAVLSDASLRPEAPIVEDLLVATEYVRQAALDRARGLALTDMDAVRSYRDQLEKLEVGKQRALIMGNRDVAERADRERAALRRHLSSVLDRKGRPRLVGGKNERARVTVGRQLQDAIEKINADSEVLGQHFQKYIHKGSYCSYRPSEEPGG
jgi:hypothetical protein